VYYRFNETNNMTGYIKELLKEFNLPIFSVYREDKPIYKDKFYIKDKGIYKGVDSNGSTSLKQVNSFYYNQKQINMTKNLIINSSIYDSYTHNYLGNYLRFIRDYKGLDLMPLYNCFSNETITEINTSAKINDNSVFDINTNDTKFKYYIVPVKFNEKYTIAIDSDAPYELACLIYTTSDLTDESYKLIQKTYKQISGSKFNKPFIYSTDIDASGFWQFEKNLKLLIKLPMNNKSSITILEGDYSYNDSICQNVLMANLKLPEDNKSNKTICKLSLLSVNDNVSYPFADRLVEYLLGQAITSLETIPNNIGRLQRALYKKLNMSFKGYNDIWGSEIKDYIFKSLQIKTNKRTGVSIIAENDQSKSLVNSKLKFIDTKYDLLSYGDKDVETFLGVAKW